MRFLPVACLAVLFLTACPTVEPDPPAEVGRKHEDLPVPDGFAHYENLTHPNPTGSWRVVSQKLKGKNRRVKQTATWYRETLPVHKWQLKDEKTAPTGSISLRFTKREEQLTLIITALSPTEVDVNLKIGLRE